MQCTLCNYDTIVLAHANSDNSNMYNIYIIYIIYYNIYTIIIEGAKGLKSGGMPRENRAISGDQPATSATCDRRRAPAITIEIAHK